MNRHIPKDLSTICLKCLERDPSGRYATAQAVADEFGRYLEGLPIVARPITPFEKIARWAKRKPALAGVAALTVVLAIGGPVTAVVIESQRRRLSELVTEKNNLIERNEGERRQLIATSADQRTQLDRWEGRANPWDLWPPEPKDGPRRKLLQSLHSRQFNSVASALAAGGYDPITTASGHIALAMLADGVNRAADAQKHWEAAAKALEEIALDRPDDDAVRAARAECARQLAKYETDHAAALRKLKRAAVLLEPPSGELGAAAQQVAALEVAMDEAVYAGFEKGQQALALAAALEKRIMSSTAASDPAELYRLVCLLAGQPPLLAGGEAELSGANSAQDAAADSAP